MQSHRIIYILIQIFVLTKSTEFDSGNDSYILFLERNLTLKLKIATRLRHNLGKILYELPVSLKTKLCHYHYAHSVSSRDLINITSNILIIFIAIFYGLNLNELIDI